METYVFLGRQGRAEAVPLTEAVWDEVADLTGGGAKPPTARTAPPANRAAPPGSGAAPQAAGGRPPAPEGVAQNGLAQHGLARHGVALHGDGWYVSAFWMEADMTTWERHASGERLVIAQTGAFTLVLEYPDGSREHLALNAAGAVLVPCGCWHRLTVNTPGMVLFITPSHGMEHRLA